MWIHLLYIHFIIIIIWKCATMPILRLLNISYWVIDWWGKVMDEGYSQIPWKLIKLSSDSIQYKEFHIEVSACSNWLKCIKFYVTFADVW